MHFSVINDKVDGIITVISLAIVTRSIDLLALFKDIVQILPSLSFPAAQ